MLTQALIDEHNAFGERLWAELISFRETQAEAANDESLDPDVRKTFAKYTAMTNAFLNAAGDDPDIFTVFMGFFMFRSRISH
jgi:hypothetical protein